MSTTESRDFRIYLRLYQNGSLQNLEKARKVTVFVFLLGGSP